MAWFRRHRTAHDTRDDDRDGSDPDYSKLGNLADVYLEYSRVLRVDQLTATVVFELDAVLNPSHPLFREPPTGQHWCRVRGRLVFPDVTEVIRMDGTAAGESSDDENTGEFYGLLTTKDAYLVDSDWGLMTIRASSPPRFET